MYNRQAIIDTLRAIKAEADTVKPYFFLAQPQRNAADLPVQKITGHHSLHVDIMGYSHCTGVIAGEFVDVARNYLCEEALRSGAKYMVFMGDDVAFPYDGILRLHETVEKNPRTIVVGVYYLKLSTSPLVMVNIDGWVRPAPEELYKGGPFEVYTTGLDCAIIPTQLLKEMKASEPENCFCATHMNQFPDLPFCGEDNFFYYRSRKLGWKVLCDPRCQCLHCDVPTGKYTAMPGIDLSKFITNIPITTPLVQADKEYLDKRWLRPLAPPPPKVEPKPGPKGPELYAALAVEAKKP